MNRAEGGDPQRADDESRLYERSEQRGEVYQKTQVVVTWRGYAWRAELRAMIPQGAEAAEPSKNKVGDEVQGANERASERATKGGWVERKVRSSASVTAPRQDGGQYGSERCEGGRRENGERRVANDNVKTTDKVERSSEWTRT